MRTVRCSDRWGGVSAQGGCLPGGCVCLGGVCPGGCLAGGVCLGGCIPACTEVDTPLPPVDRILDTRLWKYYLATTSLQTVIVIQCFLYFEPLLHQIDTVVERQKIGPQTAVLYVLALPLLDTSQWLWSYERFIEHVHFCWRMLRWLCFDWEKKMYCKIE